MRFIRKHKKISIILLIVLTIFLITFITFGKYILNITREFILETKGFYFESSILNINGKSYSINNWDGVNKYTLTIDLTNRKSADKVTTSDISYDVMVKCSSGATCEVSKEKGVLYQDAETDSYQITVIPNKNFYEGDKVVVETSVTSTSPYGKTLSATYNIGVLKSKFSYDIEDEVNNKILKLNLTNSINYYEVEEGFNSYEPGSRISLEEYLKLPDNEKEKCFSSKVIIEFDPHTVFIDMTDKTFLERLPNNYETTTINGHNYVSKFSFKVDASSSKSIIFYKDDISKNYTYPIVSKDSIIKVSVTTAK